MKVDVLGEHAHDLRAPICSISVLFLNERSRSLPAKLSRPLGDSAHKGDDPIARIGSEAVHDDFQDLLQENHKIHCRFASTFRVPLDRVTCDLETELELSGLDRTQDILSSRLKRTLLWLCCSQHRHRPSLIEMSRTVRFEFRPGHFSDLCQFVNTTVNCRSPGVIAYPLLKAGIRTQ